jgi:hypothetical protein
MERTGVALVGGIIRGIRSQRSMRVRVSCGTCGVLTRTLVMCVVEVTTRRGRSGRASATIHLHEHHSKPYHRKQLQIREARGVLNLKFHLHHMLCCGKRATVPSNNLSLGPSFSGEGWPVSCSSSPAGICTTSPGNPDVLIPVVFLIHHGNLKTTQYQPA